MCGRFTQKTSPEELARAFELSELPADLGDRFNVAPQSPVLVVPSVPGPRRAAVMQWGLVPRWAKDPSIGARLANGRSETAAEKPAFREALQRRRGLLLMDGFFEWATEGRVKVPYYFRRPTGEPFAVAALYERWTPPGEHAEPPPPLWTTCLLTCAAAEPIAQIHDRMPVVLPEQAWSRWLQSGPLAASDLQEFLRPLPDFFESTRLARYVNDARHEGPECLQPDPEVKEIRLL